MPTSRGHRGAEQTLRGQHIAQARALEVSAVLTVVSGGMLGAGVESEATPVMRVTGFGVNVTRDL